MNDYDKIADWYADHRDSEIGVEEVRRVVADLSPGAAVLDVGCGNGIPISRALIDMGFDVYGIDSIESCYIPKDSNCGRSISTNGTTMCT